MAKKKVTTNTKKKIVRKNIANGIVHIAATYNNTLVTISDEAGNVISWSSAGGLGFKGSKKSTPFAAQQAVEDAMGKAKEHGIKFVGIKVQGPGSGRDTAVKAIGSIEGIKVRWFKDVTPLPHNGCRPPKRRRV
jgi:small subunit ribosomal protein S11